MRFTLNKLGVSLQFKNRFFDLGFHAQHNLFGTARTLGVSNVSGRGKNQRVLFVDYDKILFESMLLPEIKYLQETYQLSDFYILKSSQKPDSYHVICLDNLPVGVWQMILQDTSSDESYKNPRIKDYHCSVLRIAPKGQSLAPRYITTIHSKHQKRIKSKAHAQWLKLQHDVNTSHLTNLDDNDKLIFTEYSTLNYIP